jgi:hypothetical protein
MRCATVAVTASGGHTLTPLSSVCRHEVRKAALVVLLKMTGTVMSDRDAIVPLNPVSPQASLESSSRQIYRR